ncbi:MAG TPA: serine/threonine-protein kinase, partial [Candidatus Binataceae bacterium]|nr:serine/threonine-protein kinase [Candidatus Binataceae bacterium]
MADTPQADADTGPLSGGTLLQNRYLIQKLIGGGGMGVVYLAQDQRLANRSCALKEMVDHFIDPQQRREANEYFAREADTLAQLRHPAIPAVSDRFDQKNRHYLVMEYVEGRNLEEEMAALGHPLEEGLAIDIARQLCEVLAYLHNFSPPIVYRDMKPSNVMLTPKSKVMLIDFGIARLFKVASKGTMIGTLGFAPPEQYQGQVDPRSDIYSLGATLHYVLTGRDPEKFPPFSFPPIRSLCANLSPNLAGAIDRALSYNADGRPHTAGEFRDMMLYGTGLDFAPTVVSPKSGTAGLTRVSLIPPEPVRRRRRSGLRRAVGFVVFTAMVGSLAFGATYVYSNPALQKQLGIQALIDGLPWKHQELVDKAREHPLEFQRMTLQLSTRDGKPVSPPKAKFLDTELAANRYLAWVASFKNGLTGLEGRSEKVEARFFDPNGLQIASSDVSRFIGPAEKTADFSGVALIPDLSDRPHGAYKVGLFSGDKMLAEQQFSVDEDVTVQLKAKAEKAAEAARAKAAEAERKSEAERLVMLEDRRRRPLELLSIAFRNTTKSGTPVSGATSTFDAARVLFVGWELSFKNRLYGLDMNQYRVDAAYVAPDGHTLGSVDDVRMISEKTRTATFSGRIGNSSGNAFLPGLYNVNFYLNGQYLAQRKFRVVSTTASLSPGIGLPPPSSSSSGLSSAVPSLDTPTVANGKIDGLAGKDNVPMEIRLRPQPNGFLHGELVIH